MKILCWNVNGIRAVLKKGFESSIEIANPDIVCVQETKIRPEQITDEMKNLLGYESTWSCANRPGYSGVATFSRETPKSIIHELGGGKHDDEGRLIITEFENFVVVNVYIPNGGRGDHRIQYKLDYYDEMLDVLESLRKEGKNVVICGDFNTAHKEIDLARPKQNEKVTGFLPVERAWLDKFTKAGYVDIWRHFNEDVADVYTWWSYRGGSRQCNVGWRIDYFFVNEKFLDSVESADIIKEIEGSDHCPIVITLKTN